MLRGRVGWIGLLHILALGHSACAAPPRVSRSNLPASSEHYHVVPAHTLDPIGWAVLLPGSSGLSVLGDDTHYFDAANRLAAMGLTCLVVDYKAAFSASTDDPDRPPTSAPRPAKFAWAVDDALDWAEDAGSLDRSTPGLLVGWSLGGSAVWPLTTPERVAELDLAGAVAFYPVVEDATVTPPAVPVLVLTGDADDVTELAPIRELVDRYRTLGSDIELVAYPGAHHGFDIDSLAKPRTVRLIPFIGPKATFGYDADATADAWERLAAAIAAWTH